MGKKQAIILILLLILFITPTSAKNIISFPNNKTTCFYLFYLNGCPHCENLEKYIETIQNNYNLEIKYIDARTNSELLKNFSEYYNIPKQNWGAVPVLFIGKDYCIGDIPCINLLNEKLEQYEEKGISCINPTSRGEKISLKEITGLALVDAINPCEMAVLILILTTLLLRYPEKKKKVLFSGLAFSFAIFLGYLFFGILIITGFKSIINIGGSSLFITKGLGVIAIILGILNIKDFFFYKQGGFATEMPIKWRPKAKKLVESVTSIKGAFIIGILITIFLVPCTSGPYFIAGGILANLSWANALSWLIYYNLLFIMPMLIITIIIYSGLVQVEHVSNWRERNIKKLHLIAGIIMIFIGLQLIFNII